MPRFLDTLTGDFVWKDDPRDVIYAILSHTWRPTDRGGEQSYDDVRKIQRKTRGLTGILRSTIFSHPGLSDKIKGLCKVARQAGYRLVWDDTCCIDKSSSAELSEAINSMYNLYRLADMCYIYLEDVPDGTSPDDPGSEFERSKWHKRGWTLQELIAPKRAVFLTKTWRVLGTKLALASTLERVTGIDFDILTGRTALKSVSIARRLSWAARRETTRVEDRAYSLMGIFGVHMPTIYGEGANAFLRLQEEIIKTIPDQSIYVWGGLSARLPIDLAAASKLRIRKQLHPAASGSSTTTAHDHHGLLTDSPDDYANFSDVQILPLGEFAQRLGVAEAIPPLSCVFTPQGACIQVMCINLVQNTRLSRQLHEMLDLSGAVCGKCHWVNRGRPHSLALLQCEDTSGSLLALPLCRPPSNADGRGALLLATHFACHKECDRPSRTVRLAKHVVTEALKLSPLETVHLTILRHRSRLPEAPLRIRHHVDIDLWSRYVIFPADPGCVDELAALGFTLSALQCERPKSKVFGSLYKPVVLSSLLQSNSLHPLWQNKPFRQTLRIEVALTECTEEVMVPSACFSASNWISDANSTARPAISAHASLGDMKEAPPADDTGGSRTSALECRERTVEVTGRGVLPTAEFVVYADADWENNVFDLRLLQLRLEVPLLTTRTSRSAPYSGIHDVVCLHVALSDPYRSGRRVGGESRKAGRQPISKDAAGTATSSGSPLPRRVRFLIPTPHRERDGAYAPGSDESGVMRYSLSEQESVQLEPSSSRIPSNGLTQDAILTERTSAHPQESAATFANALHPT